MWDRSRWRPGATTHDLTPSPPRRGLPRRSRPPQPPQEQPEGDPNVEVLTRGPIHEAYAMPVSDGRTTGLVIAQRPPEPVQEQPPEVKPEGNNASWISGYWSWDDERKDFIWVSGVWRVSPPAYRWMPGYWQEAQGGWQWVSGYWMPGAKQEVEYLPQPPATIEQGPTSAAPGPTYFWVPGHWQWRLLSYVWVPGYWAESRPDLVWVHPTYYWCPRGYVYCDGYWDYPLEQRGLMFSPVYFSGPVAYYQPAVCIDSRAVTVSLFSRPAYCHYYYGDYYGDSYVTIGIRPWFYYGHPRYGYDPLFCYYRAYNYRDPHWEANLHAWHAYYVGHPEMRPPHTLAEQRRLMADPRARERPDFNRLAVGHTVSELRNNPNGAMRVQSVPAAQRMAIQQSARQAANVKNERSQMESRGATANGRSAGPQRESLAKMPSYQAGQPAAAKTARQTNNVRQATRPTYQRPKPKPQSKESRG